MLSPDQQKHLDDNGYVRLPKFLAPAEVDEILAGLAEVQARWRWHTDGLCDVFLGQKLRPLWQVGLYLDDSPRLQRLTG